jgi:mono/diheme cytochrome c family protein
LARRTDEIGRISVKGILAPGRNACQNRLNTVSLQGVWMKRLGLCALAVWALVSVLSAQSGKAPAAGEAARPAADARPKPVASHAAARAAAADAPAAVFEKYCSECHSGARPKANLDIEKLTERMSSTAVGEKADTWDDVLGMLESRDMPPPDDAEAFPTDKERASAVAWIKGALAQFETEHGGEPGRVTVRRLTSAEYAYTVRDLTGVDIKTGIDASSDSVGGEGFANFGDVQSVQDTTVEHYLEAAKQIADHAVIGAGPLGFHTDAGESGLELSALDRINNLYASRGFRVVSGEGGRPFGFERYAKALYVAWYFKHRTALGDPSATLRGLAAKEGITGRFADHIWDVVNRTGTGYPSADMIGAWQTFAAPTTDAKASIAKAREEADALTKKLVTWPSWFFARGDLAAGGAGDETPLLFDDTTLTVKTTHSYTYGLNRRFGRPTPGQPPAPSVGPGPWTVHLTFDALNKGTGTPVVIYRNARVALRTPATLPQPFEPVAITRQRVPGPVLKTFPLRDILPANEVARLQFGVSVDGTPVGPNDFAATGPLKLELNVEHEGYLAELHTDVELGANRDAVIRVMLNARPDGPSRVGGQRVFLGDTASAGYKTFRAGIAEFVAMMPPNSHGEANPADRDPVPPPFDNTYNSPEHDGFVIKVKYQRIDDFFTRNMVDGAERAALEHAWTDLFGSWPYHDAYFGMLLDHFDVKTGSRKVADMTPARIAALPAAMQADVKKLKAHYDATMAAMKLAQPGHVDDVVEFAGRAWRRPLTAGEQAGLRGFYRTSRSVGKLSHEGAIRATLARVLMSPAFLYRVEAAPRGTEITLNDWEMASRMSYFLWSSIPDDELRRAAAAKELGDPKKLAAQVERMTADPKARRLSTEFFGQWLGFYHFDEYRGIDTGRFPEFTDEVKRAMYEEAVSTFEYLVRERRPVKEILHADYTFLNQPLAKFYGLDEKLAPTETPLTDKVQRIEGANRLHRGGALRLGSVLTTTSAPLRTSPVKRGDWILRRILSTPTPPPPPDAGTLPADDKSFEGQTLRQRLTAHKRDAKCAACHLRIDPLGFPLEGFDAVGRTRVAYNDGKPVDTTGEFRDKTTIVGAEGLLGYLKTQDAKVLTTLSRKMIGYALGRNPQPSDRRLIAEMVKAGGDATFAELATRVVTSRQFRNRARATDLAPVPVPAPDSQTPSGVENNP